jgi:hypothetical protein
MKFLPILLVILVFWNCIVVSGDCFAAQSGDTYSLHLQGYAWNHSTLSALIIAPENESWWNPAYLNDSLRAIGEWNDATQNFAANYSDYSYLAHVNIRYTVATQFQPNYDIYINWTETSLSNSSDEVGLAQTYINVENVITNCTISLAAHTAHGIALGDVDMQNIALHELGHSFGLGHSNYTGDLMYSFYSLGGSPEGVSTLDVYGVSTLFAWIRNPSGFLPVDGWLKANSVTLPSQINYRDLPVSPQNQPPQTLADNSVVQFFALMFGILLHPEIAVPVGVVILFFVVVALVLKFRGHRRVRVDS